MPPLVGNLITCVICQELLGDTTVATPCGHLFHHSCMEDCWSSFNRSCPICRVFVKKVRRICPSDTEGFQVTTKREVNSLQNKLKKHETRNTLYKDKVADLILKLDTSKDALNKSQIAVDIVSGFLSNYPNREKDQNSTSADKLDEERDKMILLQKEAYQCQSINSAELNKLKSEIEKLKSEKASSNHDYKQPSTSSKNARSKNSFPLQIQSLKLQSSPDNFLSNCHFYVVDELRKVSGATHHLDFNEHRVKEYGGTVAYRYTNAVTHVIGISQTNYEVLRGLSDGKKCVTDFWLSDVIAEKKIKKPWLVHHFPIPYSKDNLPHKDKQMAILNFDYNEYHTIKAMAEVTGATIINKITHKTFIVISQKLEGGKIFRALSLKIPVVNVHWITDILLGANIGLQQSKHKKYQKFDLLNPFRMNYDRVSRLMEAWDERPRVPQFQLHFKRIVDTTMPKNKRMKRCVTQECLPSGVNNGDSNNTTETVQQMPSGSSNTSNSHCVQ